MSFIFNSNFLETWANCITPDCQWKQCTWAGTEYCYPCTVRRIGQAEVDRRYNETHSMIDGFMWNGEISN